MSIEKYLSPYKSYITASEITGLSEIQLQRLRIRGKARAKTTGYPDFVPLIHVGDIKRYQEQHNKITL